jgi:hypothetical protein
MEKRKITVKHYLNMRAKAKTFEREKYYPLYIQIIVNGRKAQIKSRIDEHLKIYRSDIERLTANNETLFALIMDGYFSEKLLTSIAKKKIFPLLQLLEDEVSVLKRIIVYQRPFEDKDFNLVDFGRDYEIHTTEITRIIDDSIKASYRKELKDIFLRTIDLEDNKEVFKIVNYFIHFINWEHTTFNAFYESTYDIMPSELRGVENLLSNELRISIKAYLTYLTKVNIVSRLFERRQTGRISTLSFLDWQTEIKEFLHNEFAGLLGDQMALQYIIGLDNILLRSIEAKKPTGI